MPTRGTFGPGLGPGRAPGLGAAGPEGFGAASAAASAAGFAGAGLGALVGAGFSDAAGLGFAAGFSDAAGLGFAAGPGFAEDGFGPGVAGDGLAFGAAFLAPGFGPSVFADLAGALSADEEASPDESGNASLSRRTTGTSRVDDADLTNSPCSRSFAKTSLLVTLSSFAISWTRGFPATVLLSCRD